MGIAATALITALDPFKGPTERFNQLAVGRKYSVYRFEFALAKEAQIETLGKPLYRPPLLRYYDQGPAKSSSDPYEWDTPFQSKYPEAGSTIEHPDGELAQAHSEVIRLVKQNISVIMQIVQAYNQNNQVFENFGFTSQSANLLADIFNAISESVSFDTGFGSTTIQGQTVFFADDNSPFQLSIECGKLSRHFREMATRLEENPPATTVATIIQRLFNDHPHLKSLILVIPASHKNKP